MSHWEIPVGTQVRIWWSPTFVLTVTGPGEGHGRFNASDGGGWTVRNLRAADLLPASYPASDYPAWALATRLVRQAVREQGGVTGNCPDALSFAVLAEVQGNDPGEIAFYHWAQL